MFATIFRRKESTVQLALKTFEEFGMIEIIDGAVTIPNWGKHQNLESMERRKEYMKEYMREYRTKQAQLLPRPADESEESSVSWSDLKEAFNNECAYCGKSQDVAGPLQQEHIIPFNCDGEYTLGNIIPACKSCNTSKGKKNMSEWYAQQCFFDKERLNKIIEYTEGPEDFVCKRLRKHLHKQTVSTADKIREDKRRLDKNIYVEVVDYLNNKIGSKYKATAKPTREKIHARVEDGFTLDNFKTVIDKKADEWIGTEQEKYLRPETLFGTKFEGYLNQNIIKSKKQSSNPFLEMLKEGDNEQNGNEAVTGDAGGGVPKLL